VKLLFSLVVTNECWAATQMQVFMFRYYVFVCIPPGKAVPEMTYTVLGGTLNPTHSLTHSLC